MEYTVSEAKTTQDVANIDAFIRQTFLPDMPLLHMFSVDTSLSPSLPSPHNITPGTRDTCVVARDPQGNLAGVAVIREDVHFETDSKTPVEWVKMVEFMDYIEEVANLESLPKPTAELFVLSVHPEWRQRGVAKNLAQESMRVARLAGFKAMRVCCTSEFTARLARSLGWREHYRLAYKDYPRLRGCDVDIKHIAPHDYLYYYVTNL